MIYRLSLSIFLLTQITLHAQEQVIIEKDFKVSGNLIVGQDLSQDSVAGMIRWDTVSMTFQGFNGNEWITFSSPSPSLGTDTLEVGDSYGGGIVFFTSGSHGLIVNDFDLGLPSNIISTDIPWAPSTATTGATSTTDGATNTELIVSVFLNSSSNGDYAAKICDDFVNEGFDDWYLPSYIEFQTMSQAIGLFADPPLTDLANLTADYYWTSTELSQNQAQAYNPDGNIIQGRGKYTASFVRAIRAY